MTTGKFIKFPSIEKFSDVNARIKRRFVIEERPSNATYKAKVKLHGTNAGIRIDPDNSVYCFKRTGICNVQNDNAGFAAWVETVKDQLPKVSQSLVIYGEWAGPGVQKKVAVSLIPKKTFFVFAVLNVETKTVAIDPERIKEWLGNDLPFEIMPWADDTLVIFDFRKTSSIEEGLGIINKKVEECDANDPYIKQKYGIDGIGEGYVYTPFADEIKFSEYEDFMFKAKGKSHQVAAHETNKAAQADPAVLESAAAFAKMFVTPARCEQGITEACAGEASMKTIGSFMAWIGNDVKKESANELEASGLEWKQVSKSVNQQARDWFIRKTEETL